MTADLDLARALVADPRWEWRGLTPRGVGCTLIPDLDDPATAGVLVGMLGRGWLFYQRDHDGVWEVSRPDNADIIEETSLGRAAARAWLAVGVRS